MGMGRRPYPRAAHQLRPHPRSTPWKKHPPHLPGRLHDHVHRLRDAVRRLHDHLGRLRDRLGVGVGIESSFPRHKASQAVKTGPQDLSERLLEGLRRHREGNGRVRTRPMKRQEFNMNAIQIPILSEGLS